MSETDEDYEAMGGNLDSPPSANLRRQRDKGPAEVSRASSRKNTPKATEKTTSRIPTNLKVIAPMRRHVSNLLKGHDLDPGSSLRIVRATLELQTEYLEQKKKLGKEKGKKLAAPAIRARICRLFGISSHTYAEITRNYFNDRFLYSTGIEGAGRTGNTTKKEQRIPHTKQLEVQVREFVRVERRNKKRVTARQLVDFFVANGVLYIPHDGNGIYTKTGFQTAYRATRRWLFRLGYKGGRRQNQIGYKPHVLIKRNSYLRQFFLNRAKPKQERLREVYLDESYIHQHYHRLDDSLWDPNDDQDVQVGKMPHGGSRYCFLAAIQGPNPRVDISIDSKDKAGLVSNSLWAFCPQRKADQKGDYHKVFNGTNFLKWWEKQLLPNLKQPSLIILDNAAYHCVYPSTVPKISKLKKNELIEYMRDDAGLDVDPTKTAVELRKEAQDYVNETEKIAIVAMSQAFGHKVLFTPPYHSDLQPIELLWARVKGQVGRQYALGTTLDMVYLRLIDAFDEVEKTGHDAVNGMIEKCATLAQTFYDEMDCDDEVGNDDDEDDDDSSDGSQSTDDDEPTTFQTHDVETGNSLTVGGPMVGV